MVGFTSFSDLVGAPSASQQVLISPGQSSIGLTPLPDPRAGALESGAGPQTGRAGFWIRLAAWVVDLLCLFLMTTAFAIAALTTIYLGGQLGGEINDQVITLAGYSTIAIVTLSSMVYCTVFVGACGQTPGKMFFRLKIIRTDGQEMTYGRALVRLSCLALSLLLFGIGFLMIAYTSQKRGLHDMLAGTSVVRLQRLPRQS